MAQDCQSNGLEGNLIGMEIPDPISPWSFLQPSIQPCTQTGSDFKSRLKTHSTVDAGIRILTYDIAREVIRRSLPYSQPW